MRVNHFHISRLNINVHHPSISIVSRRSFDCALNTNRTGRVRVDNQDLFDNPNEVSWRSSVCNRNWYRDRTDHPNVSVITNCHLNSYGIMNAFMSGATKVTLGGIWLTAEMGA